MAKDLSTLHDLDRIETQEWLDALASVVREEGIERAQYLLNRLLDEAKRYGVSTPSGINTPYVNTISVDQETKMPDDQQMIARITSLLRWNAVMMVLRAGKYDSSLGGHIASFASSALLYEIGFNYFFHARNDNHLGDMVFIQGHSSPGIYARAYLEGRITEEQMDHFRQEISGKGLASYPHPWSMPDFWQFPTVSMGLGPLQAIYQARFLKYLESRELIKKQGRKVWAFLGDGEMDEVESLGAITVAAREKLDNLIFVINCNLQRLDGPVRGNGKIIQELEGVFRGAGWNVIKVIWGGRWDPLFAKDKSGLLMKRMEECVDGEYQNFKARDGAYVREQFFNKYPELAELVKDMSDEDIWHLNRGGHDPQKIFAAYTAAVNHTGQPTVILAKTVKGYGMGTAGEGQNITHQQKKMTVDDLKVFAKRFDIPVAEKIEKLSYYRPDKDSPEIRFIQEHRNSLGGYLPKRYSDSEKLKVPDLAFFEPILKGSEGREISTTMAFVRVLTQLLKDKNMSERIVPIVADESRTFGMEGLFRQIGIYSPVGQLYEPEDKSQLMYYREDKKGQLLQEGISEAGAFASWLAAATSYSNNALPMIPFYIYYSMFGFQRIGDLAWAAGDMRARGFLLGSLAGRTTLAGEGLQHDDGQSLILSSVIPTCISYDPTYAYEVAVIIQEGLRRMYQEQENIYYYITLLNENYAQPPMPKGVEEGILKGMYLLQKGPNKTKLKVTLLSSGAILREALTAADWLHEKFGVSADVWSVTSFIELRREAMDVERYNLLHPKSKPKASYVAECLDKYKNPVIAATDFMKMNADQIRSYVKQPYYVLGTDGFGRSDTRPHLREYFEVNAAYIAYTALKALTDQGDYPVERLLKAQKELDINPDKPNPARS